MTNSIASAKCPNVLSSGNYDMSQTRYTDDSKEYIFVKLTDSAYRAVEEYQRNENGRRFLHGQCAKIQFIGNSGFIHFPTPDSGDSTTSNGGGGRQFGFAIDDVEGSLECIQQKQNELDVLGSLSYRMRIHANEDIYDTTRTKMAIAEETEKSKCIREIKPNQTDIGRKVKKQPQPLSHHQIHQQQQHHGANSGNIIISSNTSNSISSRNKRASPLNGLTTTTGNTMATTSNGVKLGATASAARSPNPTLLGGSGTVSSVSSRYGSNHASSTHSPFSSTANASHPLTSASSLSSALADGIANGYASASTNSSTAATESSPARLKLVGTPSSNFRGTGSDASSARSSIKGSFGGGSSGNKGSNSSSGSKLPDISRRKIRERLIHLLALKPFKKPELYARLQKEGLRERERPLISNILKDISTLSRDNTYNLRRQMWNDVNENWPYYTEQELQLLKRRKPQNLTPPLSSDAGSSTSGQSPTSTHTGSPPPLVVNNMTESGNCLKRSSLESDRYDETLPPKKQRISHYKKDALAPISGGAGSSFGTSRSAYSSGGLVGKGLSYSPIRQNPTLGNSDEHFGDSDLSYNVLDNADDFISHLDRNSGTSGIGISIKKPSNINDSNISSKTLSPQSENVGNNRDKPAKYQALESSSSGMYAGTSVPENKSYNRPIANSNGNGGSYYQRQSPSSNTQQNDKASGNGNKNGSPVYLQRLHASASSPRDGSSTNSKNEVSKHSSTFKNKSSRAPTPPTRQPASSNETQNYQFDQQQGSLTQSQQRPMQHAPSPTQQIADAASSYTSIASTSHSSAEGPLYDFSKYTPITTIEQRRQYKTEFESDYDEYLKLLEQIDGVAKRFTSLAQRLENAQKGCPEFDDIKQQIVSEYERIRNQKSLKRDKQRFDYLHEKLAYIKQLVTDYDKTLTSGNNGGSGSSSTSSLFTTTSFRSLPTTVVTTTSPDHGARTASQQLEQKTQPYYQQPHNEFYDTAQSCQLQRNQHQEHPQLATTSPLHFSGEARIMPPQQVEHHHHHLPHNHAVLMNDPNVVNTRSHILSNEKYLDESSGSTDDEDGGDGDGDADNDNNEEEDDDLFSNNSNEDDRY